MNKNKSWKSYQKDLWTKEWQNSRYSLEDKISNQSAAKINVVSDILITIRGGRNLKGELKLEVLNPCVKNLRWVYYGDSNHDTPLFKSASCAHKIKGSLIAKIGKT